jgi:hypothetical protein
MLDLGKHGLCASSSKELGAHQETSQAQDKRIKHGVARIGKAASELLAPIGGRLIG